MGVKRQRFNIIDAHTHVFKKMSGFGYRGEAYLLEDGKVRWANGEETDFLLREYGDSFNCEKLLKLMDSAGVYKAVLLQGSYYGFCNEYIYEAQTKYPDKLFGMGTFDPYCGDYLTIMKRLIEKLKFRGLKFEISAAYGMTGYHPDFSIISERMYPVWEYANNNRLVVSLDFGTFHEPSMQTNELARIAKQYPDIIFIVEHLFSPKKNDFEKLKTNLDKLSDYANINYTVASLPVSTGSEIYPYPTVCRYLEIAKEMIGAKKLMWGSDVPTTLIHAPYHDLINFIADSKVFNNSELEDIYSQNAKRVYKLL